MNNLIKAYNILKGKDINTTDEIKQAWDLIKGSTKQDFDDFEMNGPEMGITYIERAVVWAKENDDMQIRLEHAVMVLRSHEYVITEVFHDDEQSLWWAKQFKDLDMADTMEFSRTHNKDDAWLESLIQIMVEDAKMKGRL